MSGASSRRKGHEAERNVVAAIRRAGWRAITSRAARGGYQSGADIISDLPVVIEVKNEKALDLAGWLRQAEEQAGDDPAVVVHKRRGEASAENWYATMRFETLLRLLDRYREEHDDAGESVHSD